MTLKNFASPWTNRDQSVFVPLNDYSATVIGIIRDERDFREILSGDILYDADGQFVYYDDNGVNTLHNIGGIIST